MIGTLKFSPHEFESPDNTASGNLIGIIRIMTTFVSITCNMIGTLKISPDELIVCSHRFVKLNASYKQ
jgi:hypothetical protein